MQEQVRVLVVDDQRPFRAAASAVIARMPGWSVVGVAETGEEAVTAAAGLVPDLVLMDFNLPGIDGVEAATRVAAQVPGVRTVLCSTYRCEDLPDTGPAIAAYLHKEELGTAALTTLWRSIRPAA
jgi:DNA-binding NarL/FixJ family response regulator